MIRSFRDKKKISLQLSECTKVANSRTRRRHGLPTARYARLGRGLVSDDESSSATDASPAQFRKAEEGPRQLVISGKQGPGKADREEEKDRAERRAG